MANAEVTVLINARDNLSAAIKTMEENVGASTRKVKQHTSLMAEGFKELAVIAGEAFAAKKLLDYGIEAVKAFDSEALAAARLSVQFGKNAEGLIQLAAAQAKVTRFSKDELVATENILGMHKLTAEQVKKLIPVIEDYASKSGHSLTETADAFTYAIQYGSTRSLRQFGIELDKTGSQQSIFNTLVKLGGEHAGEFSEKLGEIGAGPAVKLGHEIAEITENIGKIIVDSAAWRTTFTFLEKSAEHIKGFTDWMAGNTEKSAEKNQADLEKLQQRIRVQQNLLNITNQIKEAESTGKPIFFGVDSVNNPIHRTLEEAKEIQARMAGIIGVMAPKAENAPEPSKFGTRAINPGKAGPKGVDKLAYLFGERLNVDTLAKNNKAAAELIIKNDKQAVEDWRKIHDVRIELAQREADSKIAAEKKYQDQLKFTQDMAWTTAEMTIQAGADVAAAFHANAREQAAIAGTMALVQGAQAVMGVLASYSTLGPIGTILANIQIADIIAMTAVQEAKIAGAKFAFGGVVPGNPATGDSVPAMLTPGERVLTVQQQRQMSNSHTYHIDNSTTITGTVDPRAVRDFNRSKQAQARNLIQQLRYLKMTGANAGTFV